MNAVTNRRMAALDIAERGRHGLGYGSAADVVAAAIKYEHFLRTGKAEPQTGNAQTQKSGPKKRK